MRDMTSADPLPVRAPQPHKLAHEARCDVTLSIISMESSPSK
jgi:hypothetical protein